jgi:hypothetical protein
MANKRLPLAYLYGFICAACALMCGCAKPEEATQAAAVPPQKVEAPVQPQSAPAQPQQTENSQPRPAEMRKLPQPSIADVRDAIKRIFQNAVSLDETHHPSFFVADFNGDGSQDIAAVVKPADAMLPEINSELANWILEDPKTVSVPGAGGRPSKALPARVQKGDELIAIVHGFGPTGWRNPDAKQTYLLKGAVGANMKSQLAKDLLAAANTNRKLPPLRGDVINETLAGEPGLIFWTGSKYGWYRRGEEQTRVLPADSHPTR